MAFLKHIGKHADRKVAVIFRQIPGDDHMCLCIYPDLLPINLHDPLMKVLESPVGQSAEELADALNRNMFPDGRNMLQTLHAERLMKRVQTEQILMTPTMQSNVRLSELNKILNEMKKGEDAVRKMAELDGARGLVDPKTKRAAEAAYKDSQQRPARTPIDPGYTQAPTDGALDDRAIAANMLTQAVKMHNEATSLINEAARMKKEAERMFPGVKMMDLPKMAPLPQVETEAPPAPVAKRGRPAKAKAAAHATE
jgi:hypothetical protein